VSALKYGLLPKTDDDRDLKLARYTSIRKWPTIPDGFGHFQLIPAKGWGMLGNDEYGDCAWADPAHGSMVLNAAAGRHVKFTTEGVLSDYAACTGFSPADPSSDRGTDMRDQARYRQKIGIVDANRSRHKIGAYVWLEPGDWDELIRALYVFGVVDLGIEVQDTFQRQFADGDPLDYVPGAGIEGGHAIPAVGRLPQHRDTVEIVTWGQRATLTRAYYEHCCTQALVSVSADQLNHDGITPEGFSNVQLARDLAAL
jgi:hypothetical protein